MKTVDKVLSSLSKAINQLDQVATINTRAASEASERITYLEGRKAESESEAERAERVKTRLEELLS